MILRLLGLPETPTNLFLLLVFGGMFFYFALSGISYLIFFVWGRERFHPTYTAKPEEIRAQMKWGVGNVLACQQDGSAEGEHCSRNGFDIG